VPERGSRQAVSYWTACTLAPAALPLPQQSVFALHIRWLTRVNSTQCLCKTSRTKPLASCWESVTHSATLPRAAQASTYAWRMVHWDQINITQKKKGAIKTWWRHSPSLNPDQLSYKYQEAKRLTMDRHYKTSNRPENTYPYSTLTDVC
jgi:hypothetical protein